VNGATDVTGNDLKAYTGTFTKSSDTVKPAVKQIKQLTDTSFAVYFTEDLDAGSDFVTNDINFLKADGSVTPGTVVGVDTDADGNDFYEVTLPAYATGSSSQTLTLLVAAGVVADAAGNTNNSYTTTVTFSKDKTAPTFVSQRLVKDVSGQVTGVELTFSENVTIDTSKVRVLKDNVELVAGGLTSAHGVAAKKHTIDFGAGATLPTGSYTVVFNDAAVVDAYTNTSTAFTTSVQIDAPSSSAPTINAVLSGSDSVVNANEIVVHYNQAMDVASITNLANYKLDGVALDSTKANPIYLTYAGTVPTAHIELKDGWNNFGSVSATTANSILTVSGTKDSKGTVVTDTNIGVLLHDNKAAVLTSAVKSSNSVVVTFNESLDLNLLDATDFVVKDASGNVTGTVGTVALVAGNDKQVQINFTTVPTGAYTVETAAAANLTDLNGLVVKQGVKVSAN
jgi:trimeric autotransporter adhesin